MLCEAIKKDGTKCKYKAKIGEKYCGIHLKTENKLNEEFINKEVKIIPIIIKIRTEYEIEQREKIKNIDINNPKNHNLLFVKYPNMIDIIDFEKTQTLGIDIFNLTHRSSVKLYWLCVNDITHQSAHTSPSSKFRKERITGCKECANDKMRIHDKELVKNIRNRVPGSEYIESTVIGDDTETYILNLLKSTNKYKNVEKIGNLGGKADIKIEFFDGIITYIQIKTLAKLDENQYRLTTKKKYPDDMLIVAVNRERTHFALDFSKNFKNITGITLNYNCEISKYNNIIYENVEFFLQKLCELVPLSAQINKISETTQIETLMLNRFENFCLKNNIIFHRNDTNGDAIDGNINNFTFQAKYIGKNKTKTTYDVNARRSCGKLNGKYIYRPYDAGDFEYIVIEIGGTIDNIDIYKGNFCIIPSSELEKRGILKNKEYDGQLTFCICPPDYKKEHWAKKYWNNIENIVNS